MYHRKKHTTSSIVSAVIKSKTYIKDKGPPPICQPPLWNVWAQIGLVNYKQKFRLCLNRWGCLLRAISTAMPVQENVPF